MAKYTKFEDLPVWNEAVTLDNRVLDLLENRPFAIPGDFRNQLNRAAVSVSNNKRDLAEKFWNHRLQFLRSLSPAHPLYNTAEACVAGGEANGQ